MANVSAATENADQLRRRANRRLLGAAVLLLIAIILVPIFLEREPPPLPDNVEVKIPPVEGTKFDPKLPERKASAIEPPAITEPSGAQAVAAATSAKEAAKEGAKESKEIKPAPPVVVEKTAPEKTAAQTAATSAVVKAAPPPGTSKKSEPEKSINVTKSEAPTLKTGQLIIQVIAVRDPEAAKQTYEKAKALKMPAYTERVTVSNGQVTRVRVGPYDNKAAAEKARAKLAQAGFEAKVITLP